MTSLQSQVEKYVSALSPVFREEFRRYRQLHPHKQHLTSTKGHPYWKEIPRWLENRHVAIPIRTPSTQAFFDDIAWAQHSLFLFGRIQDDLFDGDAHSPALIYISDLFLLEADRVLAKYFAHSSRFWTLYRGCLKKAAQSTIEVDALQRVLGSSIHRLETAYSGVNSIFKIGPAAICLKAKKEDNIPSIFRFADRMAIIGQVIDDLRDFEADLERKRFNYAAQFLLGRTKKASSERMSFAPVGDDLVLTGAFAALFDKLRSHLKGAENAIKPLAIPEAAPFIQRYRENLRHMENHLNNVQVEYLLSKLMK